MFKKNLNFKSTKKEIKNLIFKDPTEKKIKN